MQLSNCTQNDIVVCGQLIFAFWRICVNFFRSSSQNNDYFSVIELIKAQTIFKYLVMNNSRKFVPLRTTISPNFPFYIKLVGC